MKITTMYAELSTDDYAPVAYSDIQKYSLYASQLRIAFKYGETHLIGKTQAIDLPSLFDKEATEVKVSADYPFFTLLATFEDNSKLPVYGEFIPYYQRGYAKEGLSGVIQQVMLIEEHKKPILYTRHVKAIATVPLTLETYRLPKTLGEVGKLFDPVHLTSFKPEYRVDIVIVGRDNDGQDFKLSNGVFFTCYNGLCVYSDKGFSLKYGLMQNGRERRYGFGHGCALDATDKTEAEYLAWIESYIDRVKEGTHATQEQPLGCYRLCE